MIVTITQTIFTVGNKLHFSYGLQISPASLILELKNTYHIVPEVLVLAKNGQYCLLGDMQ